jgi:hypothetical protein
MRLQKAEETDSRLAILEKEIHAVFVSHDVDAVAVGVMLEENLLKIKEGSLVCDTLTHLHHCMPHTLRITSLTVLTLLIPNRKLDYRCLLHHCSVHHLLLDSQLDLQSPRMLFSPNPYRIYQFQLR